LRLGWSVAPRPVLEKLNLGKQGADLCSSPVTQLFVATYFRERDWRVYLEQLKELYARRRDTMLEALEQHFAGKATWTRPQGGMFIWATLDGDVDTTDLLANSQGVAFVPGRAAYMDERSGASSMRLNFAGVPDEDIREGIRRIGQIMSGRAGLFGILTGSSPGRRAGSQPAAADTPARDAGEQAEPGSGLADVVELPRRGEPGRAGEQSDR
jgi:2-aminoadipate transaminase